MKEAFDQKQIDTIVDKFNKKENFNKQQIVDNIVNKFSNKRENNLVESVKQLAREKRLLKLIELGVLGDLEGYQWGCLGGDRFYVFASVNGVPVPMYKSSTHTGGKRSDLDFFVFFGTQAKNQDWLIKGDTHKDTDTFYGVKELEDISKILTEVFNFNTDRIKKVENKNFKQGVDSPWDKEKDVDNFVSEGKEVKSSKQLNQLIEKRFGVDFNKINQMPAYSLEAVNYVSESIFKEIK
jgi:hypothetical protein